MILTRDTDFRLSENLGADLTARANISNRNGCDAYVSVHLNACNRAAHGVETYSFNGANTPELAKAIHRRVAETGFYSMDRGTKIANFAVLRETWCIAALIECGFIDHDGDAQMVHDHTDDFARAIAAGICDYLGIAFKGGVAVAAEAPPGFPDMAIMGEAFLHATDMASYLLAVNPNPQINCSANQLAQHFLDEGAKEGVRGDLAFAQSLKETGFFRYGGQVKPDQNNFAGIGATNGGAAGATFATPAEGVRAQIQHLKAYASMEPLIGECIDPRFDLVQRGVAPNLSDLSGRWAWPGYDKRRFGSLDEAKRFKADYGAQIVKLYYDMKAKRPAKQAEVVEPPHDNTPDGWAAGAIEWAVKEGLLKGDPSGNLRLHDGVTREELYAVLQRYDEKKNG